MAAVKLAYDYHFERTCRCLESLRLFGQVQVGINLLADSLVVEYDSVLHYPTTIVLDPNWRVVNDELALYASELKRK